MYCYVQALAAGIRDLRRTLVFGCVGQQDVTDELRLDVEVEHRVAALDQPLVGDGPAQAQFDPPLVHLAGVGIRQHHRSHTIHAAQTEARQGTLRQ